MCNRVKPNILCPGSETTKFAHKKKKKNWKVIVNLSYTVCVCIKLSLLFFFFTKKLCVILDLPWPWLCRRVPRFISRPLHRSSIRVNWFFAEILHYLRSNFHVFGLPVPRVLLFFYYPYSVCVCCNQNPFWKCAFREERDRTIWISPISQVEANRSIRPGREREREKAIHIAFLWVIKRLGRHNPRQIVNDEFFFLIHTPPTQPTFQNCVNV